MRPRNGVDLLVSILKGFLPLGQVASNPAPQNGQVWVQPDGLRFQASGQTVQAADAAVVAANTAVLRSKAHVATVHAITLAR